jgi:hypothetical protein
MHSDPHGLGKIDTNTLFETTFNSDLGGALHIKLNRSLNSKIPKYKREQVTRARISTNSGWIQPSGMSNSRMSDAE